MSYKLSNIFAFATGVAIGAAVTCKYFKTKYERIAQEEIESVKETFSAKKEPVEEDSNVSVEEEPTINRYAKPSLAEYAAKLTGNGYTNYSNIEVEDENVLDLTPKPYVISPSEFDTEDGYEAITLYYHTDGVVADDMGEVVENFEDIIGSDFHVHYGEYEDDAVHIRNEKLKTDYEILLHPEAYLDAEE